MLAYCREPFEGETSAEEFHFKEGYPSMPATDANKALLAELNKVNRALGMDVMEPYDPSRRGAGDLSFVAPYVASISGQVGRIWFGRPCAGRDD